MESYKKNRQKFMNPTFRQKMKEMYNDTCVNCGSKEDIQYHHIVPLKNGGTNRITNIVPLCSVCHGKAHAKIMPKTENLGRKLKVSYDEAEPILKRYFDLEIGTKECKELLGLTIKNKSTWYKLKDQYKSKNTVKTDFYNNIDLVEAKTS